MGEAGRHALRVGFDRAIKLEFHGARVSSDAGLFPYRDLDEVAGLTESAAMQLFDFRTGSTSDTARRRYCASRFTAASPGTRMSTTPTG